MGILSVQVYWVLQAYQQRQKQFDQTIFVSLLNVAEQLAKATGSNLPYEKPVIQHSTDYYIVNVNDVIDANMLEYLLKKEFAYRNLKLDFEYAIYDCFSDQMVYGDYVSGSGNLEEEAKKQSLPTYDEYIYYFGVNFPTKSGFIYNQLKPWLISTFVALLVALIFSYALMVILKQKRLSEVQKDFINNMTHEFKTPITTIGIAADVLSTPGIESKPGRLSSYVGIIKNENERLHNQVMNVLQMARIDKGKINLNLEKINLHELLQKTCQHFNLTHSQAIFHFSLKAENSIVKVDKLHARNVFTNLIDNAIKYSPSMAHIHLKSFQKNGKIFLSIRDEGPGIDKVYHKKVFQKFFRVPTGNLHDVKGFGLGLNYVANIAKAHGWDLNMKSELGKGTEIEIGVPYV